MNFLQQAGDLPFPAVNFTNFPGCTFERTARYTPSLKTTLIDCLNPFVRHLEDVCLDIFSQHDSCLKLHQTLYLGDVSNNQQQKLGYTPETHEHQKSA